MLVFVLELSSCKIVLAVSSAAPVDSPKIAIHDCSLELVISSTQSSSKALVKAFHAAVQ